MDEANKLEIHEKHFVRPRLTRCYDSYFHYVCTNIAQKINYFFLAGPSRDRCQEYIIYTGTLVFTTRDPMKTLLLPERPTTIVFEPLEDPSAGFGLGGLQTLKNSLMHIVPEGNLGT